MARLGGSTATSRSPIRGWRLLIAVAVSVGVLTLVTVALATGGRLHFVDCFSNNGAHGCTATPHASVGNVIGVAVSPDGHSVYAASFGDAALTTFDRASDGTLTPRGCIASHGAHGCVSPPHNSLGSANS